MSDIDIYSKRCWYGNELLPATVQVRGGIITAIHADRQSGAIDAGDNILMPGVIDAHVHVNEPGRTDWEGFATATRAAAKGGTTTIIDMPLNAHPVTTTLAAFNEKINSSKGKLLINCGFYGGFVPANVEDLLSLIDGGVLGIKCFLTHSGIDEFPNVMVEDLNRGMPLLASRHVKLLVHCELLHPAQEVEEGLTGNYFAYLQSRPDKSEVDAVILMIDLCRKHNCAVHIVHVSSSASLYHIQRAKDEGLPITAETCAHYIYFNAEDIPDNNTSFKCAPPIRGKKNNADLTKALANGTLDFLASDHSPAPPGIKEIESGNIFKAWGGIAGLQFLLSASWSACRNSMSLETFIPLLTAKPAVFLGLNDRKGNIEIGMDADLVIWDPEGSFEVDVASIEHRHKISPYIGEKLYGVVQKTIVNGQVVYDNQGGIASQIKGKVILNVQ